MSPEVIDPTALSVITSSIVVLGTKVTEGAISAAGKSLWENILKTFGWKTAPPITELAQKTAEHLQTHPEHATQAVQLLKQDTGSVGMLVGRIDAEKVVVAQNIGTLNM